jgi:hypothetical protein
MSTHNSGHDPKEHFLEPSVKEGYEVTDVSTSGIFVFLLALGICVVVFFVFCFGMGKVINNALTKADGPLNKWNAANKGAESKKNLESNPALEQQELHHLTQSFPTPRLQMDDGNQDLADLHDREDLLLNYYSWVDSSHSRVRIPIERAMEMMAKQGFTVVPQGQQPAEPLMTGDSVPTIQTPLTNGFARTGYEQEEHEAAQLSGEQASTTHANHQ